MRFPRQLKEHGKVWKDFESSSLLSRCFEIPDSVILRYRPCVRPGGQVGPCRSQKTLKGTWAGQVLLFLLHVVHIQRFRSVATFEYWWSFSMHLNASLSCKSLTAHVEQQMHSKACIGPIIWWTSEIHMCCSQNGGRLLPCLGMVSILYDYSISIQIIPFVADEWFTIFQWWTSLRR